MNENGPLTLDLFSDGCGIGDVFFHHQISTVLEHVVEAFTALLLLLGYLFDPGAELFGFHLIGRVQHLPDLLVPVVKLVDRVGERIQRDGYLFQ